MSERTRNLPKSYHRISIVFALGMFMFIAGCINYEQTTHLNMDGSGTAEIHYWTEENGVMFLSDAALKFDEEKIKKQYQGEGIAVKSVKTEMQEDDSTRHVYVTLEFKDVNKLADTDAFENIDLSWAESDGMMKFEQVLRSEGDDEGGNFMMDQFKITYTYHMPGEIISSNATEHDGQKLVWKHKLSDLSGEGVKLSATVKMASGASEYVVPIVIIAGALFVLIVIFSIVRKRKAPQSADSMRTGSSPDDSIEPEENASEEKAE